jgi:hypothetical protein
MELITLDPIIKLTKDLKTAARVLSKQEARYLVDSYYTIQDYRIAVAGQIRSIDMPVFYDENHKKRKPTEEEIAQYTGEKEPHEVLDWMFDNVELLENQIKNALNAYTDGDVVGTWLKGICGIGPVIAAGLIAHIDIETAPTAGHIWSFAGYNPEAKWEKGKIRPWNAKLKVVCWKAGQSFVKVSNNEKDIYGKLYQQRKALEQANNEAGIFKAQADRILQEKKISKTTDAYKWYIQGKLPPAHIQARAERYAVKIFLSHLHAYWYKHHYGIEPPKPFAIAILGHAHMI